MIGCQRKHILRSANKYLSGFADRTTNRGRAYIGQYARARRVIPFPRMEQQTFGCIRTAKGVDEAVFLPECPRFEAVWEAKKLDLRFHGWDIKVAVDAGI